MMNSTSEVLIDPAELRHVQHAIDRLLIAEGAGHIVHDLPVRADGRSVGIASRPWRVDPIPYAISGDDFAWIEQAVAERMAMLESILGDLYGARSLVADGLLDPALLWGSRSYRLAAVGAAERRGQRRWLSTYSVDLVRTVDGQWQAIADHTDAAVGLGYALLDRNVTTQALDGGAAPPRPLDEALELVRRALVDSTAIDGPRIVLLTSGIDHPAYVEHSYMATQLGFNLVEGPDLVVRERKLWLQTLGGLERVDVLYRRIGDRQLDPLETNTYGSAGIPAILMAADAGDLGFANSHGAGLIEDQALLGYWDRAGQWLTGREPQLALRSPATSAGSTAIDDVLGRPAERVACFDNGEIIEQPIVLRFHAVATDDGIAVVPGGNGRVIEAFDNPLLPTPCRAKDVWVLGDPPPRTLVDQAVSAPQVDFITSVPTRAADSLYWLCRAAERAEAVARSLRVLESAAPVAGWAGAPRPTLNLLVALAEGEADVNQVGDEDDEGWVDVRRRAIRDAARSIEFHVGSMLAESASVREFLSATTGRVLAEMVESRQRLADTPNDVEAIDALLFQLSAFGGLWSESVVRGPAWYFGDFAKRYERALIALTGASAAVHIARLDQMNDVDRRRGLEGVLASNDSLVAYRRRHRSDVELGAVLGLLLHDERNPRSCAASISGMFRNASAIGWNAGIERIEEVAREVGAFAVDGDISTLDEVAERLHALAAELTSTRLVAPPNPTLVRPRLVDPGAVA
jgi:uncharacterized circularly permuted ATP-grasp superfamily protein/uncharacterized alpha-E superfamily protein